MSESESERVKETEGDAIPSTPKGGPSIPGIDFGSVK